MNPYQIIDEPKSSRLEYLIVNPIAVLFVSIFLPIFWTLPFYGKWWMPFAWLVFNGYLLGSPTLLKEILISILGILGIVGLIFGVFEILDRGLLVNIPSALKYATIIWNAFFFLILYLVVFTQTVPYEIYSYVKKR